MKTLTNGAVTATYVYNALGQFVKQSGGPSGTVLYVYDEAGHLLGEYDSTGGLIQETIWMGDTPVATIRPGTPALIYYVHTDHLDTPRRVTRPSDNQLMWIWYSDPFGTDLPNENPAAGGTFKYNLRFPGQLYDSHAGLNQNYFRDYDPAIGRYVQSDPIGLPGGINTYLYAMANPLHQVDVNGLVAWRGSQFAISAIAGGGATRYKFTLTSQCVGGKRGYAEVIAGGFAVGVGVKVSGTSSNVEFEDNKRKVDPFVFEGVAKFAGASWALGFMGYSWQVVQLGEARTIGGSFQTGYDASISGGAGTSTVVDSRIEDCCEIE